IYFDLFQLQGHRQITDLYLAGLAHCYRASLATFDTSIPVAALVGIRANILEVIPID
ncbi:MAG: VapC toxin family PIN domain ribonuclease, partial [Planctomycetaceae bacterium]